MTSILKDKEKYFAYFMPILEIACLLAFIAGGWWGKRLAAAGITSDNALEKHQKYLGSFVVAIALFLGLLIIIDKLNLAPLLPQIFSPIILIYLAATYDKFIFVSGFFILGLLVLLETSGKRSLKKTRQLIIAVGTISIALNLLFFLLQPVTNILGESVIDNGVVIQTTEYTCAPSSIATLGRYTKKYPYLTEKDVTKITKTNRLGTTTLSEIKTLKTLNFNPEYKHNLTIKDLININKPALLDVKERNKNNKGVRFSHAVALLRINPKNQQFIIGNPYYGLQIKTVADMKDYWFGEAIIIHSY